MHLILSHEQADFDAVASLYAASLVYSEAAPVLPQRLNRNVRGYLTLYGENFSFIERGAHNAKIIDQLTVVDSPEPRHFEGLWTEYTGQCD